MSVLELRDAIGKARVRVLVERFVERTFFGSWARKEDELRSFVERASYVSDATVLQVQLLQALGSFAGSSGSVLFQFNGGCYRRTAGSLGSPSSFGVDHPVVLAMRAGHTGERMPVDCLPSEVAFPLPMAQRGHLRGFVLVGRNTGADTYRPDQIAAMHWAAQAVGEDLFALSVAAMERDLANERAQCARLRSQLADDYIEDRLFHPLRGMSWGEA